MKATADRYAVVIAYFLIYVVWGSTYYFIGVALEGLPTFLLGALRFSVAGAVLLLLCHIRGEKVFRPALIRRSAVSGIVLLFVDMAVIMLAQRYVSSSLVAIVARCGGGTSVVRSRLGDCCWGLREWPCFIWSSWTEKIH